ncbi:hypothetical protein [Streptomyces sp. CB00455]|uniref:hypothetical protein n=1 Tax=Streptomyces sp. CB00455 TaxID=1703927 RepID=UPI0013013C68|nr:hypothetical protein [Streptomyces sp. CB00455]
MSGATAWPWGPRRPQGSFTPIELDHPDPFGVTVVLMEEDGYRISLTEAFTR